MTASTPHSRAAAPAAIPLPSTPAFRAAVRSLLAVLCAAALGLGLAGCGGGGGQKSTMEASAAQRAAVSRAIQVARTAVDALTGVSTTAQLRAAEDAVEAAKAAVADANALSDAEKDAHDTTISVIEGNLAEARELVAMARGDDVAKLSSALDGDRIASVSATVEHGATPTMSGTVPGTPATTVTDLETTAVAGSAVTAGGWTGGIYAATDETAGTSDEIVFYTDVETPGTRPFAGEMGKYGTADGIDADGNLPIGATTDATLIASSDFPTRPGIRIHMEGTNGEVEVAGTFDGAPGTYTCTPAMDDACTSSIRHGGGIALAGGGGWKFVPDAGATVASPDTEYRYFGWWLRDTEEGAAVAVFHGGVGGDTQDFANLSRLQGTATYSGPAIGKVVTTPRIGAASGGDFTADATLEVDFGDDSALGTIEGTVDGFMVNGDSVPWSVELQSAAIAAGGAIGAGGTSTARTVWSIDGQAGDATGSPTWSGRFHDVDENELPNVATGTFEAAYGELGRMSGAFGTTSRQPHLIPLPYQ